MKIIAVVLLTFLFLSCNIIDDAHELPRFTAQRVPIQGRSACSAYIITDTVTSCQYVQLCGAMALMPNTCVLPTKVELQ